MIFVSEGSASGPKSTNYMKNPGISGLAGYPQSGAPTPHARGQRTN